MTDLASGVRCWETTTDLSSPFSLSGVTTVESGVQTFVEAGLSGKLCHLMETHKSTAQWQWSLALITAGSPDSFTIQKAIDSSDGEGVQVSWSAGTRDVFIFDPHWLSEGPVTTISSTATLGAYHRFVICDSTSAFPLTLPPVGDFPGTKYVIKTVNSGEITITEDAGDTSVIESSFGTLTSTAALSSSGAFIILQSDGIIWRLLGSSVGGNTGDVTLAGSLDYLTIAGQVITRNAIDLTTDVTGDLPVADGGTGSSTAAGARANLGVDAAGTDNSTDVTLAGTPDYLTIAGQVITRGLVDLTTDVTGALPSANLAFHTHFESDITDLGTAVALVADNLSVFAATTSAQLAGVISDETGSGALVFASSPSLVTPNIGAATGTTLSLSGDITNYEAVNDGNPELRLGSADAEELHIKAVYDSAAQTLDYVLLQTDVASATANKGLFRFNVDGSDILDIDDGGIDLDAGKALSIAAADVLNATTLGSGVVNSSLTSVGTISTGTWEGTTIAIANGGTGQTTLTEAFDALAPTTTKGDLIVSNGTDNIRLAVGANDWILKANSGVAAGVEWAADTSDVAGPAGAEDNGICRFHGVTGKLIQDASAFASNTLSDTGDMVLRSFLNDGNPSLSLGSGVAEDVTIRSVYDSGAQTLDYVSFATTVASATASRPAA